MPSLLPLLCLPWFHSCIMPQWHCSFFQRGCLCDFRWKEENQSCWQWAKSRVEWSECSSQELWAAHSETRNEEQLTRHVEKHLCETNVSFFFFFFSLQGLEFDLKGLALDASSFIDVIVKDYETIGHDKYVIVKLL